MLSQPKRPSLGWARLGVRHVTSDLRALRQTPPPAESYDKGELAVQTHMYKYLCGPRGEFLRAPLLTLGFHPRGRPEVKSPPLHKQIFEDEAEASKCAFCPAIRGRSAHLGDNRAEPSPAPLSLRQHVLRFPLLKNCVAGGGKKK